MKLIFQVKAMPHLVETDSVTSPELVLAKAVTRAAERLGLAQKDLALILGASAATLSRIAAGKRGIDPSSKEGELALLFVRVYRSLDALVGGDDVQARAWLHATNEHVGGVPAELLRTAEGLVHVALYLDAMRGRL
jgi:transcriptional regulator with XRE-family HTH domain